MRPTLKTTLLVAVLLPPAVWAYLQEQDPRPVNERGPANAPVTVVEYCEYGSQACAQLNVVVNGVMRDYQERVRFVFHYLSPPEAKEPLQQYAAFAAGAQGHFWEMHDMLFANQDRASLSDLVGMAKQLRLDADKFRSDLSSQNIRDAARQDRAIATAEGVTAAPTVVIDGRRLSTINTARDLRVALQEARAR